MNRLFENKQGDLARQTRHAVAYNFAASAFTTGTQLLTFVVLARLLSPADYGLVMMVTPFVALLMLVGDFGLSAYTIQAKEMDETKASTLFYLSASLGLALAALFALLALPLARLYHEPRVTEIGLALSATFLVYCLTSQHQALLQRSLQFRTIMNAQIAASSIATAAAIALGYYTGSYWALVLRFVLQPVVYCAYLWMAAPWLPSRFVLNRASLGMLRFGGYIVGFGLLNTTGRQADNVLIGWRWGEAALGPYGFAYRLFLFPVQQITQPLGQVLVPSLSRLREEPEEYRRYYVTTLRIMCFLTVPPFLLVAFAAPDVIYVLGGPKWAAAAEILRYLAPIGALHVGYTSLGWLMLSQEQADRYFKWACIAIPLYICSFLIGLPWGAEGVALSYAVANLGLFIPGIIWCTRRSLVSATSILRAMLPALLTAAALMVTALILHDRLPDQPWIRLLLLLLMALVVMGLAAPLFFPFIRQLRSDQTLTAVLRKLTNKSRDANA